MKKKINFEEKGSNVGKLILLLVFVGLICVPCIKYYNAFSKFPESTDPTVWGTFGDFFGGVLNPVIAFASLVVLAYISLQISKNDSDEKLEYFKKEQEEKHKYFTLEQEQKHKHIKVEQEEKHNYFILEKRMDAFRRLLIKFNAYLKFQTLLQTAVAFENADNNDESDSYENRKKAAINALDYYKEFLDEILFFGMAYEHLFEYNFHSKEFKKIIEDVKEYKERLDIAIKPEEKDINEDIEMLLIKDIDNFIEDLRKELVIKE